MTGIWEAGLRFQGPRPVHPKRAFGVKEQAQSGVTVMIGHTQELKFEAKQHCLPRASTAQGQRSRARHRWHGFSAVMEQLAPQAEALQAAGLPCWR